MSFIETVGFVARREYVRTVRRRGFRVATLLIPVLLVAWVLFIGVISESDTPDRLVVVNDSALPMASATIPSGSTLEVVTELEARSRLSAGEVEAVYVVPADVMSGGVIERVIGPDDSVGISALIAGESAQLRAILASFVRAAMLQELGVPEESVGTLLRDVPIETIAGFNGEAVEGDVSPATILAPYAFALVFVLSIFTSAGYLLQSVAAEKENRVVEILLSTSSPLALMLGKIIGLGAAGLTQISIWIVAGIAALVIGGDALDLLASLDLPPAALAIAVLYFLGGYLLYAAVFSAIGAASTGVREAQQLSSLAAVAGSLPIMLFSGIVAILVAGRLFQASLLLSGTRPSLRRLAQVFVSG